MTNLKLILQALQQGVTATGVFDVYLLLRLQAPEPPAIKDRKRTPLHLAVVLDRSGSMSGQPLQEACRCASAIAGRLTAEDQLAVITYDNRVSILRACGPIRDLALLQQRIMSIGPGGCTNLHGGWAAGIEALRKSHRPDVISRVLLLSDGVANEGITDAETLASAAFAAAHEGLSTSTYGLGRDFEEGLMTAMAREGAGKAYYGDLAEDLMDPFMEEFDLLSNMVARRLTVSFAVPVGITLTQLNGYPVTGTGAWVLPDLAYMAEAWALFKLEGSATGKPGEALDLGRIEVSWQDTSGQVGELLSTAASLIHLDEAEFNSLPKDALVATRLTELRIGHLQKLAYQAAAEGDWDLVRTFLDEMKALAVDNSWSKAVVDELSALMERRDHQSLTKELFYGLSSSMSRLAAPCESSDIADLRTSSYTRRKPRQGKKFNSDTDPSDLNP